MNRRVWVLLPLLVFAAIAIFFAVGLTKDPRRLDSILINQPIPDFDLPPIKGRAQGLASADLKGQVSLVNIFGSWCVACQVVCSNSCRIVSMARSTTPAWASICSEGLLSSGGVAGSD